jgi:uncharacterized repeat protein (TIGR01451 family)
MLGKFRNLAMVSMLAAVSSLYGAGTASGTDVLNTATLSYTVGGGDPKTKTASTTFKVDDKVAFTVTPLDTSAVSARSGATNVVLTYKVRNDGNAVHDFALSDSATSADAFSGAELVSDSGYDVSNVRVVVDSNGNGIYDDGVDTATFIDELASDAEATVFIVADIPDDAPDAAVAVYDLEAQVAVGGEAGVPGTVITSDSSNEVDQVTTVQIVFADGDGTTDGAKDGKYGAADAYKITTAKVTIIKNSIVLEDPVNGTTNPKRIPGAVIRYCFIVENAGSSPASDAIVTDNMDNTIFDFTNSSVRLYTKTDNACACDTMSDVDGANGTGGQTPTNSSPTAQIDFGSLGDNSKECGYVTATIR